MMPPPESNQSRLDQLAESFAARYRNGERPSISEYVDKHPDLAEAIQELFPALEMMEQVDYDLRQENERNEADNPPDLERLGDFRIIREIGRGGMGIVYEAEQVSLGRRVALKILPQHSLLDSKYQKRFVREAKAAARLHHTNIVPVFGVGEQDGLHYYVMQFIQGLGLDKVLLELVQLQQESPPPAEELSSKRPDLANRQSARRHVSAVVVAQSLLSGQFRAPRLAESDAGELNPNNSSAIQKAACATTRVEQPAPAPTPSSPVSSSVRDTALGDGLRDTQHGLGNYVLPGQSESSSRGNSRRVYWESVARMGVQAAQALQYAHDQGIIHRDIKPGNLLLDVCGTVWITDFGLAKSSDQQDLTRTGDLLGTLRYMAPEQFEGQADNRSDLYSLGLTLYELVALRPAFDEHDRNKLIKQVTTQTPERLPTLNGAIPKDLVTIVHKAIDSNPSHRYQTAGELAGDLERFLHDEPIQARRISRLARFTRWCKRNPAIASLTSMIAVLLMSAVVVFGVAAVKFQSLANRNADLVLQANRDKTMALNAKSDADAARRQAEGDREKAETGRKLAQWNAYVAQLRLLSNAWIAGNYGELDDLLEQMIPGDGEADFRHWEWYYLRDQVDQRRQEVPGHIRLARWSPDGRYLATLSDVIELRDAKTLAIHLVSGSSLTINARDNDDRLFLTPSVVDILDGGFIVSGGAVECNFWFSYSIQCRGRHEPHSIG